MRKHCKGRSKTDKIPWIGRAKADPCKQSFKIVDGVQIFPQFIPCYGIIIKSRDCILSLNDLRFIDKGLLYECPEQSPAHGSLRPVQNSQKRSLLLLIPYRLSKLKISP